jgi:hypothetical protein
MGKSTISMVIFNSYVRLPEGSLFLETPTCWHCSSKKPARCSSFRIPWHPELETTSESWHGTARVTTTGTLHLTGQHRCQTENKWMSKHVKNCHNPIDTWHGGWMLVGLSSFVGFFPCGKSNFCCEQHDPQVVNPIQWLVTILGSGLLRHAHLLWA